MTNALSPNSVALPTLPLDAAEKWHPQSASTHASSLADGFLKWHPGQHVEPVAGGLDAFLKLDSCNSDTALKLSANESGNKASKFFELDLDGVKCGFDCLSWVWQTSK